MRKPNANFHSLWVPDKVKKDLPPKKPCKHKSCIPEFDEEAAEGKDEYEIRERWPSVEGVAIVQRIGKLMPGTPTVLIACTAGHRDTGVFEAARYGIDRLKQIVPIWKKEVGPEGEEWVEGDYFPSPGE